MMDDSKSRLLVNDPRVSGHFVGNDLFLDVGCGSGLALDHLDRDYRLAMGIDLNDRRYLSRSGMPVDWSFVLADAGEGLPIATGVCDVIFANQVIEHVFDPYTFADEVYRALRAGGVAVVTTPNVRYLKQTWSLVVRGRGPRTADQNTIDGPWDDGHVHYFTHTDLRHLFDRAGFAEVSSKALIDLEMGGVLRGVLDQLAESFLVREFLSGNVLLTAVR